MRKVDRGLALLAVLLLAIPGGRICLAADPVIHVDWDEPGDPPVLDIDFTVSTDFPASPDFPDVELITGSLTWRIWSEDPDNPNGIGDIGVISCPHPKNFAVAIRNDSDPSLRGVRNVKAIRLQPTSAGNYSSVSARSITGTLEEDLVVQADSSGTGGEVDIYSIGQIQADMTIHRCVHLATTGDISGTVAIDELVGTITALTVSGSVTIGDASDGTVRVFAPWSGTISFTSIGASQTGSPFTIFMPGGIGEGGLLSFGTLTGSVCNNACLAIGTDPIDGTIHFTTGIPISWNTVDLSGPLGDTGVIDLNGADVDGTLALLAGGSGSVVNGGAVNGIVALGYDAAFSGEATFASGGVGSEFTLEGDGVLKVTGTFDGALCGGGLDPSGPLPPNVVLPNIGSSASLCGTMGDVSCGAAPAAPTPDPDPNRVDMNRFISLVPGNAGTNVTIRVYLNSLQNATEPPVPPDFSQFEGQVRYVNAFRDAMGNPVFDRLDSQAWGTTYKCAFLGCEPDPQDWGTATGEQPLFVTGEEIVPSSEYHLTLLAEACGTTSANWANYSPALAATTARWGDVNADSMVNVNDITATVDHVKQLFESIPEQQAWLRTVNQDINGHAAAVNVVDVTMSVDAVKLFAFPFGMQDCPPL